MNERPFRQVFAELVWIWCPDTGEMLWDDDGRLDRRYYRSEHWKSYRSRKIVEAGWRCQVCGCEFQWGIDIPQVHHRAYSRDNGRTVLGTERLADCSCLCQACHTAEHDRLRDGVRED